MILRLACLFAIGLCLPAVAATDEELERLSQAMRTDEMVAILRDEGLAEAKEIGAETFPGRVPSAWDDRMARIYDTERVTALFEEHFFGELADSDISDLIAFFEGDLGREIMQLEISGRRAFISEDVEQAARDAWAGHDDEGRAAQLKQFIEVNDLLERNVSGALNSTLAFYQGLALGEMFELTEDEILRDVWMQEPEIRSDTEGWLYAYLSMSYEPLSDDDLAAYIALSDSEAGQDLNSALFVAFDRVFDDVSFRVGSAIALLSGGEEL